MFGLRSPCVRTAVSMVIAMAVLTSTAAARAQQAAGRERAPWDRTLRDEDLRIKLVTFGVGDAIHEYWGHNALMVEDASRGVSSLYNFGMFDFGPDMLAEYLQGQLDFWVAVTPSQHSFEFYAAANRSIRIRELDLPPARRRYLAERLAWYARPENRNYRYHHYRDNCSTKLRDLINEAIDGQLEKLHSDPARLTYRGHTRRYTEHDRVIHFLLVLWMNDTMEQPIDRYSEAFLPDELERLVDATRYRDDDGREVALVKTAYTVFEARRPPTPFVPRKQWPACLALGLALAGLAWFLGRNSRERRGPRIAFGLYQAAVGLVLGVPGLVLGLFLLTGWTVTHWNENLFLTNPLTFLAFPVGLMLACGSRRGESTMRLCWSTLAGSSLLLLALKILPDFDQQNLLPIAVYLPLNVAFALVYWRRAAPE